MSGPARAHPRHGRGRQQSTEPRTICDPDHMCAVRRILRRRAPIQALLLRKMPAGVACCPSGRVPWVRAVLHPRALHSGLLHARVQGARRPARGRRARPPSPAHQTQCRWGRGGRGGDPRVRSRVHARAQQSGVLHAGVQACARQHRAHARSGHDRGCARVRAHRAHARARRRRGVRGVRAPLAL